MNEVFFAGEQIPYQELQKLCKDLQAQIVMLQAENERLKRQCSISTPAVVQRKNREKRLSAGVRQRVGRGVV